MFSYVSIIVFFITSIHVYLTKPRRRRSKRNASRACRQTTRPLRQEFGAAPPSHSPFLDLSPLLPPRLGSLQTTPSTAVPRLTMQLASHGPRLLARSLNPQAKTTSRKIHIPSYAKPSTGGTAFKLLKQSGRLVTNFFAQIATPGRLPLPSLAHGSRGVLVGSRSIQNGLSLPVRTALSRNIGTFFPRAPPAAPRSIAQVGLGTARNFSSSRPIFQNLVQNVPIAGRAIFEVDLDLKMGKEKGKMAMAKQSKDGKQSKGKRSLVPAHRPAGPRSELETEMEQYFLTPSVAPVTTYLTIPLGPTTAMRQPLAEFPGTPPTLLPLTAISRLRRDFALAEARVSSLLMRLEAARVLEKGATTSVYGQNGVPAYILVEFEGWTAAEVRGIIGESGTAWCLLEEKRHDVFDSLSSSAMSSSHSLDHFGVTVDPAQSCIMPTLDFSFSFVNTLHPPSPEEPDMFSSWSSGSSEFSDSGSDLGEDSDHEGSVRSLSSSNSEGSWSVAGSARSSQIVFSAKFAASAPFDEDEPRERLFY